MFLDITLCSHPLRVVIFVAEIRQSIVGCWMLIAENVLICSNGFYGC